MLRKHAWDFFSQDHMCYLQKHWKEAVRTYETRERIFLKCLIWLCNVLVT